MLPYTCTTKYNIYNHEGKRSVWSHDWRGMPTGDAYSSGHLVMSHLGLDLVILVETNPFPEMFIIFRTSNILRYFLDLAL